MPKRDWSRREFMAATLLTPVAVSGAAQVAAMSSRLATVLPPPVRLTSPNGTVAFELSAATPSRLSWQATLRDRGVIAPSPLGIVVDGIDLGDRVELGAVESYRARRSYVWRGVHSEATDHFRGMRVSVRHVATGTVYRVEVRAYDDGIAFRYVVPGEGSRIPDEATGFVLPEGSTVWYHDLHGHYEGTHARKTLAEVQQGDWAAPPLTIKLPNGVGYASITEGGLLGYAGMALQADGSRTFRARLGHAHPASYPYTLRYGEDGAARLAKAASIEGPITTPWRVVMIGADLDTLVNSDIVHNVSPEPDRRLFPKGLRTEWIKPGRAVWKYLDGGGENTLALMKEFSRLAAQMGFQYNVVEGFWRRWTESELRELIDYSRQQNVGIWLWQHTRELRDPAARDAFFAHVQRVGAVGVKLDFLDHEAKEVVDLYHELLRGAAEHRLMVNFHGANKPSGESRTWPNEMTREAVSGMERSRMPAWAQHNTTIPFTRMLAGHLDFTPTVFGERRRETSWAHQIATAAVFTSPVLVYGGHPQSMLENPAVEMIKSIPSVWDETRVLPFSEIGEAAGFVRRHGRQWFVAILNGPTARSVDVPLAFLGRGARQALLVRDELENPAAVRVETATVRRSDTLRVELRAGGGFVARLS
jgi:alpha-glucosidase